MTIQRRIIVIRLYLRLIDSKYLDNKPRWFKLKGQFEDNDRNSDDHKSVTKSQDTSISNKKQSRK